MNHSQLIIGILSLLIAATIIIWGSGLKVVYSSLFFIIMAVSLIYQWRRKKTQTKGQQ